MKVISRGFSTLFTLHKSDLNEQLKDFPEVGKILRRKARSDIDKAEFLLLQKYMVHLNSI